MKTNFYLKLFILSISIYLIPTMANAQFISAGYRFSLAVCEDGTAMAWGYNNEGELGTGNFTSSDIPIIINSLSDLSDPRRVRTGERSP
jgi:alpha-tubulin suppressor-like RCC1 family protein